MDTRYLRRAFLTAGILLGVAVGCWLPRAPLGLGLTPYWVAATLWLLLSAAVAPLRRDREGSPPQRERFDRAIVVLSALIALAQSFAVVTLIAETARPLGQPAPESGTLVGLAAASMLLVWLAFSISRGGLGNGIALIVFVTAYLARIPQAIRPELARMRQSEAGLFHLPLALVLLAGLVVASVLYVRSRVDLALEPVDDAARAEPHRPPPLPLRFNLVGTAPALIASALLWLVAMTAVDPSARRLPWFLPVHWALMVILIGAFSAIMTRMAYDTRHVEPLLSRFGYRLASVPEGVSTEHFLDRHIGRRMLLSAAVLVGITALPQLIGGLVGMNLDVAGITGCLMLTATAITLDLMRQTRVLREMEQVVQPEGDAVDAEGEEGSGGWVQVYEADLELEATLVADRLEQAGVRAAVLSNRVIPLLGTLALWEWTRPRYPSLVPHRRLGRGRVVVCVSGREAGRAHSLLEGVSGPPGSAPDSRSEGGARPTD